MNQPKFKIGQEVRYHAGNWAYRVIGVMSPELNGTDEYRYVLECIDDSCDVCETLSGACVTDNHYEILGESELMEYDEHCQHVEDGGCEKCN